MPVTFKVAEHDAKSVVIPPLSACEDAEQLLKMSWGAQDSSPPNVYSELLQSSFGGSAAAIRNTNLKSSANQQSGPNGKLSSAKTERSCVNQIANMIPQALKSCLSSRTVPDRTKQPKLGASPALQSTSDSIITAQNNGFVSTVMEAYNQHRHLILRPDDVWIAILGQFNFYVNANAEKLRSHFVSHEGKKQLVVRAVGNRYSVDFGDLANQMTELIDQNIVDKDLKAWILPDFSTTTHNDTVVSSVLMMATLKAYFSYLIEISCGIPSVTLAGEKEDWEKLLGRLDKLSTFGDEPSTWAKLLTPILKRFVSAFDGNPDIDFWGKVCKHKAGFSGPGSISGWITAFCVWDNLGNWRGPPLSGLSLDSSVDKYTGAYRLILDDVQYAILDDNAVPVGFCEVDVALDDNGEKFDCMMVSGHMGTLIQGKEKDTVAPLPAWFMFIKAGASAGKDTEADNSVLKEVEVPSDWKLDWKY